ncbi:diguanylate cyclase [Gammaproteobacteria bacterium]
MSEQRARILIIDDMPANLRTLGASLSKEYKLQIATSGAQGLEFARQSPPDLILLDVMMPEMDGYETCRRLKDDPQLRKIPVIFVTAVSESDAEYTGLALGASDYLAKPVNIDIARQRIRNLLERENLRKEVETYRDNLERLAYYDPLTGVPNRRLLVDRLSQSLAQAQRTGQLLAVCYLDLDGFKPVNDQFGHETGDQLLVEITSRLQSMLRAGDTLARMGGDEFALLLGTLEQEKECSCVLERVLANIATPFNINDQSISVSASIGVTLFPHDSTDAGCLLRHADQAMYQAKEMGKNRFCFFDSDHNQELREGRERRERLALALQNQEFVLYYQLKVHLTSGTLVGAEALIRWQHPERGLVAPDDFLPQLEGSDLEVPLGEWVIETALRQIAAWKTADLTLRVSVNISAHHLQQPNFKDRLQVLLGRYPEVSAGDLELEILESAALDDLKQASQILSDCKKMGVHFSLDDFGTGYSSLSYFRELPVETLKIDQSFVRGMLGNPDDHGIVESVIGLARIFNRAVIAEGVESPEHATALVELGCVHGQGYAIARPMPANDLLAWVARWREKSGLN